MSMDKGHFSRNDSFEVLTYGKGRKAFREDCGMKDRLA